MSKPIFYKGQKVGCLLYGEGVVKDVMDDSLFSVLVNFEDGRTEMYTQKGYLSSRHYRPILYPLEQYRSLICSIAEPQPEAWRPKVGEWCWFWDNPTHSARIGKFAGYDENMGYPYLTSIGSRWMYCAQFIGELPEHLKEVEP